MRYLPFFVFFLLSLSLNAQRSPAEVSWGNEHKEPRNARLSNLIGNDMTGYYALRKGVGVGMLSNEGKIFIEKYNMGMKLAKTSEIKLEYKNKDLVLEDIKLIGDELYLFTSYRNKRKKINYLFAQTISKKSLRLKRDMKIIAQIPSRSQFSSSSFDIEFSRDSSKILLFGQLPYKANKPERYQIQVCDKELNPIWKKDIELPYADARFTVENYRVDKEGNVHVLGMIYEESGRRTRRNGLPTYKYTLLTYSEDGALDKEYKIDLGDKFITDLTFRIQKDGNPVCAGFYSEKNSNSVRGTYFFKINKETGELYNQGIKEFEFEFLTELFTDRQKKKAEKAEKDNNDKRQAELFEYDLDKLILRSDGGAVLVAEQYYVRVTDERFRDLATGYWQNRTNRHYHYNDVIVVNIGPDGDIDWATHVPKRQVTANDGGYFSSYSVAVTGKAVYLVFNDNSKNFNPDKPTNKIYSFNGSRSIVALAEIKPDGTVSKYPLFSNREEGILTRPKMSKQTDSNELIIYGERNRKYKFAKVLF